MSEFDTTTATTMTGEAGATGAGQVGTETTLGSVSTVDEALEAMRFLAAKFNLSHEVVVPEDLKGPLFEVVSEADGGDTDALTPEITGAIVAVAVADEDWNDVGYDNEGVYEAKCELVRKACRKLLASGTAEGAMAKVCAQAVGV